MLVTAFLGMTTKFVEVTLSHKYREITADGTVAGGPMYYMKNRLKLPWLAAIFAVATILSSFGTGNLPQVNSIANSMFTAFGINKMITGAVLAIILAFIIIGGIKRIAKVTAGLVPLMAAVYFTGAFAVLFYNHQNLWPAFASIFTNVFTGTAATGGFLGAGFAFAFNRGVNRGLFSNEAGQGSAPIAHAAARAHEPVSEGMVAILEPFVDTIIICFLTGMVLLSSGVWQEKLDNRFQNADMIVLDKQYTPGNDLHQEKLFRHLTADTSLAFYSGNLNIEAGKILSPVTLFVSRSIAENVIVTRQNQPFTGQVPVSAGKITDSRNEFQFSGKSLIHSAPLTAEAFKRGYFGNFGQYIVAIGLLLFAFSTAISWSYYGDRAVTYLWGPSKLVYYRIVYVLGFFLASFTDTTIIWTFSGISIALMTIPNLLGILSLRKEMKSTIKDYWGEFNKEPGIERG
jgi:alanine or glycine:cation symporter, AGCS family